MCSCGTTPTAHEAKLSLALLVFDLCNSKKVKRELGNNTSNGDKYHVRFATLLSKNTCACEVEAVGITTMYWFRSQAQAP